MLRRYQDTFLFFLVLNLAVWVGLRQARLGAVMDPSLESEQVTLTFSPSGR